MPEINVSNSHAYVSPSFRFSKGYFTHFQLTPLRFRLIDVDHVGGEEESCGGKKKRNKDEYVKLTRVLSPLLLFFSDGTKGPFAVACKEEEDGLTKLFPHIIPFPFFTPPPPPLPLLIANCNHLEAADSRRRRQTTPSPFTKIVICLLTCLHPPPPIRPPALSLIWKPRTKKRRERTGIHKKGGGGRQKLRWKFSGFPTHDFFP